MKNRKIVLGNKQVKLNMNKNIFFHILFILFFINLSTNSLAQEEAEKTKKWNFTVAPYFIFPGMTGDVAVKGIPMSIDASVGDIFDYLDFAFMIYGEASTDKWTIGLDALYMKLGHQANTPITERTVDLDMKQWAITPIGMYRFAPWAEAGLGGRINHLSSGVKIPPGDYILPGTDFSGESTWFDPIIVARVMDNFGAENWRFGLYGDFGGFGVGSKFTWQAYPFVGYRFSKLFELDLAYRWLSIDYEKGEGTDLLKYDMLISGPEIGFLFHF